MDQPLNEAEVRILGCLMEKEMTTPDYYPLSLNSLLAAANQKTNRVPVVNYDEETVLSALETLKEKGLVWKTDVGRVSKYEERLLKSRNLLTREASVLCFLMLRGPQTLGQLKDRCERIYSFPNLEAVERTLSGLSENGLTMKLPRMPGQKESRYTHLFSGVPETSEPESEPCSWTPPQNTSAERIEILEKTVEDLAGELAGLKEQFARFKAQFE